MKLSLKTKFIALGGIMALSAITNAFLSYQSIQSLDAYSDELENVSQLSIDQLKIDMSHDALKAALNEMGETTLAGDRTNFNRLTQTVQDLKKDAHEAVDAVKKTPKNTEIAKDFDIIIVDSDDLEKTAENVITAGMDHDQYMLRMKALEDKYIALSQKDDALRAKLNAEKNSVLARQNAESTKADEYLLVFATITILLSLAVPAYTVYGIFRPQGHMVNAMRKIADGDTSIDIPHTHRHDEIGMMAKTVQVFKDNALRMQQMSADQQKQKEISEKQRKDALNEMANTFEANVKSVVDIVASAATEMDATSRSVAHITETNQGKLGKLSDEIQGTTRNVQLVASATSELSSAINEISSQVARATTVAANAVQEANRADGTVQSLTQAATRIGEVLEMINSIAAQINLLALNATIEAARAGDAGKGFAVVASEVKNLANQTTKATEQISQYIESIQGATGETVTAIKRIGGTIHEISEISTAIAAAVEEQGVATQDIANNVQQAARSTEAVARDASDVSASSTETGVAASQMTSATSELSRQAETLRREVDKFLDGVRQG